MQRRIKSCFFYSFSGVSSASVYFNPIFVPSRARVKSLSPNWTTNLHQSDSDRCRSKYDLEILKFTTENVQFDAIQFLAHPRNTESCIEIRLAPQTTVQQTVCSSALCQNSRMPHTHSKIEKPMCTVFTRQKSALRHTSMDLHSVCNTEVCFGTHLRTICTVFTYAFERWAWALFISEVRFATHLREICTVFMNVYARWTWALFISEVRFSHTSARSAQFLQLLMRFGGARDLGLYNTK